MGRQSLEALTPETVLKGRGPQTVLGSPEPNAAMFFDESLVPMTSVGVKEIHHLARFLFVSIATPGIVHLFGKAQDDIDD